MENTKLRARIIRMRNKVGTFWPLVISQLSMFVVFFVAVFAYMHIEGWDFWDSCYMVVITLSTVGFQEVHPMSTQGRILTTVLILTGVGNFAFILGAFSQMLVEGKFFKAFGRRRVLKSIAKLRGHSIVCGYGRIGRVVAEEIMHEGGSVVVIEQDIESVKLLDEQGILHLCGDATSDQVLEEANIRHASNLIAALELDSANVYVVLSARQFNPDLHIVARAGAESHISKLQHAGADKVLLPHRIGGLRMAQSVLRPTVTSFVELTQRGGGMDIQMEELLINSDSELTGKALMDSGIRARFNLIVIAVKDSEGNMHFNPASDFVIKAGHTLIVVGSTDNLAAFQSVL
ncbi:potassium channel family protein [Oleidesulfovibrio sp.]|uniref:potassium channel family protein n=1 Tax=Oleidesulfovibrio sp. TaxID=2909707 RepID=UPI003A898B83